MMRSFGTFEGSQASSPIEDAGCSKRPKEPLVAFRLSPWTLRPHPAKFALFSVLNFEDCPAGQLKIEAAVQHKKRPICRVACPPLGVLKHLDPTIATRGFFRQDRPWIDGIFGT
jgi:hypothetical protein